jgi:hypothetical protein
MARAGLLSRATAGTLVGGGVYIGVVALLQYKEMRALARTFLEGRFQTG